MDMNQLFYHHQMAVIAADRAHRAGEAPAGFDIAARMRGGPSR